MRIVYLAAGAAGMHCGACARDAALARELKTRGHDVLLVPLYTPLTLDGDDPSYPRVFYGGINAYLAQKSRLFRRRLPVVDRLLSSRWLLRRISRFAVETRPEDLGEMTVSVLRGAGGRQAKELSQLIDFLADAQRPDVVNLTNSLLSSIAPEVKRRLGVPVVCTLQGEESFIGRLSPPYGEQAARLIRRHAEQVDLFLAPSASCVDAMAPWLDRPREMFRVVRSGLDVDAYCPGDPRPTGETVRVGCVSRIGEDKGTDLLCRAMVEVEQQRPGRVSMELAGQLPRANRRWWDARVAEVRAAGVPAERFTYHGVIDFDAKLALLRRLDVFVQASRFAERRGMAALEAQSVGVPVVVPRSGVFPEMLALTGGGMLAEPDSVASLVGALVDLIDDADRRRATGDAARQGVMTHYSASRMADETLAAYGDLVPA